MPAPRSTPRGPAEATGIISENAYKGAVVSTLLIPVLQAVLLKTAAAVMDSPSAMGSHPYLNEIHLILQSGMLALVLLPVASTIGSMVLAYGFAGWPGVGLYWVMSTAASAMLGANLTAALVFVTGMFVCFLVVAVKMGAGKSRRGRRSQPRR